MTKVFGLGFPKTGTTTLEAAHKILGFTVCNGHWNNNHTNYLLGLYLNGDIEGILRLTRHFDAFFDAPWGGSELYEPLLDTYPDAKFILSLREVDDWYQSLVNHLVRVVGEVDDLFDAIHGAGWYGPARYYETRFGLKHFADDPDRVKRICIEHNQCVRSELQRRGADFLEIDVTKGEGWEKLCPFLGVETPAQAFPHLNQGQTRETSKRMSVAQALTLARRHYAMGKMKTAENVCVQICQATPASGEAKALLRTIRAARGTGDASGATD